MPPLKLSVAQYPTGPTLAATLASLHAIATAASSAGVDLILFPEAFLGGYPRTCSFGAVVGSRTTEGRTQYYEYWKQAVDLGDSCPDGTGEYRAGAGDGTRERLEQIAMETGVFLVVGLVEKTGGTLYCGCVFVDPVRGIVGKRRKVMPVCVGESDVRWRPVLTGVDGDGARRVGCWIAKDTEGHRGHYCGAESDPRRSYLLGELVYVFEGGFRRDIQTWHTDTPSSMPLLRTSLYMQGVSIYLAPTADGRESWISTLRHIAMEGRCYVLGCNQFVTNETLPSYITKTLSQSIQESPGDIVSSGGSAIVGPLGDIVAGPLWGEEGRLDVVIEDLEKSVVRAKMDLDVGMAGHYARGDVFRLHVEGLDLGRGQKE